MLEPSEPVLRVGRYELYDSFASGGMARLHFGRLVGAGGFARVVAVKRLHTELLGNRELASMLTDEARLASRVRHTNVVSVIDVVEDGGELLLVMDYVPGESLANLLREAPKPPIGIAVALARSILEGLHAAHVATDAEHQPLGIVHRDVSPQNVIVGSDGVAKLIDFGIARAAGRVTVTGASIVKGKPRYMAPEHLGEGVTGVRTDVYSASVVLWEMLTGRPLFASDNEETLFGRVLEGVVPPPRKFAPDVSEDLEAVVLRGLARRAEDRHPTALEMARALEKSAPSATVEDVAAWVHSVSARSLEERAARVRAIERRAVDTTERVAPATTSLAAHSAPPPSTRPRRSALARVLVAIVAIVGIATVFMLSTRVTGSSTGGVGESARPTESGAVPDRAPPTATEPVVRETVSAQPLVSAPEATASAVRLPTASTVRIVPTVKPTQPPAPDCDPPTVTDERGIRRVKPGCASKR